MLDQASELRKLARQAATANTRAVPTCVTVCGAGRGAGATSTVVALAKSLSRHGSTVVLDAGPLAAATEMLGPETLAGACEDVLSGRKRLTEVLQLAGERLTLAPSNGTIYAWQHGPAVEHLWRQLCRVNVQFAVLDAGSQWHAGMRAFYNGGSELLMVATRDPEHVLNAYALIKSLTHETSGDLANDRQPRDRSPVANTPPVGRASLLVNRADQETASEIHQRLGAACQRFLGKQIELLYSPDSFEHQDELLSAGLASSPSWQAVIDVWADHLAEVASNGSPIASTDDEEER